MSSTTDEIADLVKRNPKVNAKQLSEAMAQLKELREQGFGRRQYDLASPNERRPIRVRQQRRTSA